MDEHSKKMLPERMYKEIKLKKKKKIENPI